MGNNMMNAIGFISGMGPLIRGAKFVPAIVTNASGTTDMYTCPAGKKAFVTVTYGVNGSTSGPFQIKVGGTYYAMSLSGIRGASNIDYYPIVINAGESFSFTATGSPSTGTNIWARVMEMDISTPLYTGRLLSLSAGNNTVFTVSTGKTAIILDVFGGTAISFTAGGYFNTSGSNRSIKYYIVPNGGSPGTSNQYFQNTAVATGGKASGPFPISMNSGDSFVINTDANTATQWVWVTYYEI